MLEREEIRIKAALISYGIPAVQILWTTMLVPYDLI